MSKEKSKIVIALDWNTTPLGLLSGMWYITIGLMIVAWGVVFGALFLYAIAGLFVVVVMYEGLELKKSNVEFGKWMYVMLIGTLLCEAFSFSSNYVLFVVGAYLAGIFGVLLPMHMLKREMSNDAIKEVFKSGYIG